MLAYTGQNVAFTFSSSKVKCAPIRPSSNVWCASALILRERSHPEQGFRACIGTLRLAKTYGRERLEAACARALNIGARSYSSINSILKNNLDRRRPAVPADGPAIAHDNIRGPTYFH
jgi:transposase